MRSVDKIIENIKKYKNIENDSDLAILLGVKANTISTWKARKTIPYKKIVAFAKSENINITDVLEKTYDEWYEVVSGICRESQAEYPSVGLTEEEKRYIKLLMDIFHGKNEKAKVAIKENIETFHQLCDIPDRQSQKKYGKRNRNRRRGKQDKQ